MTAWFPITTAWSLDHDRVVSDHDRVISDHDRVVSDHDLVISDHDRVVSDHDRVVSGHARGTPRLGKENGILGVLGALAVSIHRS